MTGLISIVNGDALHIPLQDGVVQTVITSPPYWGLRNYDVPGQLGLEPTPEAYIVSMIAVFREVWRVMRPDGTLWLNIGDCYAGAPNGRSASDTKALGNDDRTFRDKPFSTVTVKSKRIERGAGRWGGGNNHAVNLKPKDLVMMPARLALALQAEGWWIRSDIIWAKPNPMPESVTDRPTKSYEHVFLLTKNASYYYDAEAVREDAEYGYSPTVRGKFAESIGDKHGSHTVERGNGGTRNRRDVWTIATESFSGAHFATFPQKLVEPMILAGSSPQACETCGVPWERVVETNNPRTSEDYRQRKTTPKDESSGGIAGRGSPTSGLAKPGWRKDGVAISETIGWWPTCACPRERNTGAGRCIVLDPFAGTGTVGKVAVKHGRRFVGLELKPEYIALARARTDRTQMAMQI